MLPLSDNSAGIIWKVLACDRLVNVGIRQSANSTKQKRAAKPGISVCSRIINEVEEQPNKKKNKGYYSHNRRENDDKNAVAIVKIVPQFGCVSQDSEALVSQRGKQPRGNPMQKVLGPIRRVRLTQSTLRQTILRENKGPSLGKIQLKNPHQRSLHAVKLEDRPHEETERQTTARSKVWNLAKNTNKLKEKDKAIFYSPAEEMGTPGCVNKRAGGR